MDTLYWSTGRLSALAGGGRDWDGYMNAVDATRGVLLWRKFIGKAAEPPDPKCLPGIGPSSQPVVIGNTLYAAGGDSAVYALDKATGEQIWRTAVADPKTGTYIWSGLMPYQNSLYFGVSSLGDCPVARGEVVRIDIQNPTKPLIKYVVPAGEAGGGVWSTPPSMQQQGPSSLPPPMATRRVWRRDSSQARL